MMKSINKVMVNEETIALADVHIEVFSKLYQTKRKEAMFLTTVTME